MTCIKVFVVVLVALVALVRTQRPGDDGPPQPFEFNYNVVDPDGNTHQHQSSSDSNGRRTGSYGYTLKDGIFRLVTYEADENGYRAVIKTNEPGTAPGESADAKYDSSAPSPF